MQQNLDHVIRNGFEKTFRAAGPLLLGFTLSWVSVAWSESSPTLRHRREFGLPPAKKTEKAATPDVRAKAPGTAAAPAGVSPVAAQKSPLSPVPPSGPPCAEKLSLERFLEIPKVWSVQRDPAQGYYFLSDSGFDTPQVFAGGAEGARRLTELPSGVTSHRLSPDGKKLLVLSDQQGDEAYGVYLLDPVQGSIKPLAVDAKARVQSVAWGPKSTWFLYTSNQRNGVDFDLYRYDLLRSTSEKLADLSGMVEITDISSDGRFVALELFRSVTDSEIAIWDLTQRRMLSAPERPTSQADQAAHFTADSRQILFLSDRDGFRQLFRLPLEAEKKNRLRLGKAIKISTHTGVEAEECELSPARDVAVCALNREGYSELVGWQIDRKGIPRRILKLADLGPAVVTDFAVENATSQAGQPQVWIAASTSITPPSLWTVGAEEVVKKVQFGEPTPDPRCFASEELVKIRSFDGVTFSAFVFPPSMTTAPQVPFLSNIHGGPEAQFRPGFNRTLLYLRSRGFGIFAPNVRGSTGYGRDFTRLDDHRKRMDSVKDAVVGSNWLVETKRTTPDRLGIFGGSYGGFVVLRAIQLAPPLFAAASESVGITDLYTFLQNTKPYRRALREVEYGPLSDKEFLQSISPMKYLDQIHSPLLIFHGERDPRVPFSETQQLAQALKERGQTVELVSFKDEGHGVRKRTNGIEQTRRLAYFFEKILMDPTPKKKGAK